MSVDDAAWGEIRRCYVDGRETVADIAARFGVSVGAIRYRVRRDGWSRSVSRSGSSKWSGAGEGETKKHDKRVDAGKRVLRRNRKTKRAQTLIEDPLAAREEVVGRLYRAILMKLEDLEVRMEQGQDLSAADSERETRELSTMVRSFEKVTGVAADIAKERKPKAGARATVTADAERMRVEIAERLERLHSQWDLEGRSGQSG